MFVLSQFDHILFLIPSPRRVNLSKIFSYKLILLDSFFSIAYNSQSFWVNFEFLSTTQCICSKIVNDHSSKLFVYGWKDTILVLNNEFHSFLHVPSYISNEKLSSLYFVHDKIISHSVIKVARKRVNDVSTSVDIKTPSYCLNDVYSKLKPVLILDFSIFAPLRAASTFIWTLYFLKLARAYLRILIFVRPKLIVILAAISIALRCFERLKPLKSIINIIFLSFFIKNWLVSLNLFIDSLWSSFFTPFSSNLNESIVNMKFLHVIFLFLLELFWNLSSQELSDLRNKFWNVESSYLVSASFLQDLCK